MNFIRAIFDIKKGETAKTAGMFLYFFIVIASYWFLKPVREALTVGILGADSIPKLKLVVALVSGMVVVVYSLALPRFSRERLAYIVIGSFIWMRVFFGYFFAFHREIRLLYYCFYVFLDLFNTVNVALFWTFLADIMLTDSAKRLYGLIGAGGVLGGLVGSTTNRAVIKLIEPSTMLLIVAAVYSSLLLIVFLVSKRVSRQKEISKGKIASAGKSRIHEALRGVKTVFSSWYFLGICGILVGYELVSTINYVVFNKAVELVILPEVGKAGLGTFYSQFYLTMNLITVGVQVLLTSLVIRRLGITAALLALPLVVGCLSMGFLVVPVFAIMGGVYMMDNSLNYSINQTSREMLFVPVPRKDKYATLAFTDIFALRVAKAVGAALTMLLPFLIPIDSVTTLRWYMVMTIPIIIIWIVIVSYLGKQFYRISDKKVAEDNAEEATVAT